MLAKAPLAIEDAREHPDREAEKHHAKHGLDRIHPDACARQPLAGGGSKHNQRRAHAEAEHEQRKAAEHRIVRLTDIENSRGQGWCNAGTDNQRREQSHDGDTDQRPAFLLIADAGDFRLPGTGQLQFVETEHAQRKKNKQARETP